MTSRCFSCTRNDALVEEEGEGEAAAGSVSSARKIGFRTLVFVNRQFTAAPAGCDCTDLVPSCDSPGPFTPAPQTTHTEPSAARSKLALTKLQLTAGRDCHSLALPPCCASTDRGYTGKPRLFFKVNGLDMFVRGANFVSVDALESRVNASRYRQLIASARDSHFQIFRVNGDANYFKDEFYDLCSEMGILIWQEFMFSDCNYAAAVNASLKTPDDPCSFLNNVRAEVQHQVRRLSHQPSIAMWISNNEILDPSDPQWRTLFIDTIVKTLVNEDTARPVWPAGNSNGWLSGFDPETGLVNGEAVVARHIGYPHDNGGHEDHQYYFGGQNFQCVSGRDTDVAQERPDEHFPDTSFASEYGFLALPSFDAFSRYSEAQDWGLYSSLVQHSVDKISGGAVASGIAYSFAADAPLTRQTSEAAFRRTSYLSQLLQAQCLSAETSHYRRGRDFTPLENATAGTMGTMYWMLNSPYPSANWGSIDVTGRWRLVQYAMAQTYTPLLLSAVATPLAPPPPPAAPAVVHNVSTCRTGVALAPAVAPAPTWPPVAGKMSRHCASAAECCGFCGAVPGCVEWTFSIEHEKCYMSTVSHSANVSKALKNMTAGSCAGGACTHAACAACTGPDGDAQAQNFLVVHAANDRRAAADTADMQLRIIHFADGRSHEVAIPHNSVGANSGAVVLRQPVAELLQAVGCASVRSCFVLVSPRRPSNDTNDEGLALLANFKDLLLPAANITVSVAPADESAQPGTRRVTLTSDAVALFAMIHTKDHGRWDRNGVLLLPGQPRTLTFTRDAGAAASGDFGSTLHVDAANIARTTFKTASKSDDADAAKPTCVTRQNFFYNGTRVGPALHGVTEEECCESCSKVASCVHWTHHPLGTKGQPTFCTHHADDGAFVPSNPVQHFSAGTVNHHVFCETEEDCSLAGDCEDGACVCDGWTHGAHCEVLNLLPAQVAHHGYRNASGFNSWGGASVEYKGLWYLFASQIAGHCPLAGYWSSASEAIRGVSAHPMGPFEYIQVVVPHMAHNVKPFLAPDGTWLIYYVGEPYTGSKVFNCSDRGGRTGTYEVGVSPTPEEAAGPVMIASAPRPDAPPEGWQHHGPLTDSVAWHSATNPSPYFYPNGSVLLAVSRRWKLVSNKTGPGTSTKNTFFMFAETWRGPYRNITHSFAEAADTSEDPDFFKTRRGFHMLNHNSGPGSTFLEFSKDPTAVGSWKKAVGENAFNMSVRWDNGSTTEVCSRQRPQVQLGDGVPKYFWSGVGVGSASEKCSASNPRYPTWTLAQEIDFRPPAAKLDDEQAGVACSTDLNCSLNGVCTGAVCVCDRPWTGASCGVLAYDVTPASAKSIHPKNASFHSWGGPVTKVGGRYHIYLAVGLERALFRHMQHTSMLHGVAPAAEGPHEWHSSITLRPGENNPGLAAWSNASGNFTSLWLYDHVHVAASPSGPFTSVNSSFTGGNAAPVYHDGAFYVTTQRVNHVFTAPQPSGPWTVHANISTTTPSGRHEAVGKGTQYGTLEDRSCGSTGAATGTLSTTRSMFVSLSTAATAPSLRIDFRSTVGHGTPSIRRWNCMATPCTTMTAQSTRTPPSRGPSSSSTKLERRRTSAWLLTWTRVTRAVRTTRLTVLTALAQTASTATE